MLSKYTNLSRFVIANISPVQHFLIVGWNRMMEMQEWLYYSSLIFSI